MYRTAFARQVRLFSTSPIIRNKGPIDTAKDALKAVDRTVADTLVKSIETGGTSLISISGTHYQSNQCQRSTLLFLPQPHQFSHLRSISPRITFIVMHFLHKT